MSPAALMAVTRSFSRDRSTSLGELKLRLVSEVMIICAIVLVHHLNKRRVTDRRATQPLNFSSQILQIGLELFQANATLLLLVIMAKLELSISNRCYVASGHSLEL